MWCNCSTGINRWNHLSLPCTLTLIHTRTALFASLINSVAASATAMGCSVFIVILTVLSMSCFSLVPLITDHVVFWRVKSHVWLLLLVNCLFVGESLTLWATQWVWTGTPPGRHTTSGSLKVLWHRWHPFFSDTKIGFFRSFSCEQNTLRCSYKKQ